MDLQQDHFRLFGLPERFALDPAALDAAWRALQAEVHPDRHAHAGPAARRVALQWATHVNGAYQTLRDPARRAAYLCDLRGAGAARPEAGLPPEFLMEQMELRESLEAARAAGDTAALEALDGQTRALRRAALERLAAVLDDEAAAGAASARDAAHGELNQLMFLDKLTEEVHAALALLEA